MQIQLINHKDDFCVIQTNGVKSKESCYDIIASFCKKTTTNDFLTKLFFSFIVFIALDVMINGALMARIFVLMCGLYSYLDVIRKKKNRFALLGKVTQDFICINTVQLQPLDARYFSSFAMCRRYR